MVSQRSFRSDRVADQIQREIALLLQREVKDPRLSMVTVTAVKVSRDFSFADLYFTALNGGFSDDTAVDEAKKALESASGFLRTMLGRSLTLRVTPKLRFHYDESVRRGHELSQLIDQANQTQQAQTAQEGPTASEDEQDPEAPR